MILKATHRPHHLLFVSEGADFVAPVKIDENGASHRRIIFIVADLVIEIKRREEARAEEELRTQAARRHQETMRRIAEEEKRREEEENAAEARRAPLTASTHAFFVDQQLTEIEILRSLYSDLRGALLLHTSTASHSFSCELPQRADRFRSASCCACTLPLKMTLAQYWIRLAIRVC